MVQAHLLHHIKDAAVDRLEAIADIGEGAADDHAHGVIEVGAAHLVFDVYGDVALVVAAIAAEGIWPPGGPRAGLEAVWWGPADLPSGAPSGDAAGR